MTPRTARIFLSYKRNVEPDQSLAGDVVASLSGAGHAVFIDQRLTVGQAWAEEIEKQVRQSDYLIVFITAESSRSEMVRGEIEIARHHAATNSLSPHSAGAPGLRWTAAVPAQRVSGQDSVRRLERRIGYAASAPRVARRGRR